MCRVLKLGVVQAHQTSSNLLEQDVDKTLHTLLEVVREGSRRFDVLEPPRTSA